MNQMTIATIKVTMEDGGYYLIPCRTDKHIRLVGMKISGKVKSLDLQPI